MRPVERVLAVLHLEEPDRVPHFEWRHNAPFVETAGCKDSFELIDLLDIDAVVVGPAYRATKVGPGLSVDEWGATRRITSEGYAVVLEDKLCIENAEDLATWQPPDADDPFRYEPIQAAVDRFGGHRAVILQVQDVFSGPRDYMGYAGVMVKMLECPELVVGVVRKCVEHSIRVIEHAAGMGITLVVTGDDIAGRQGPLFSPYLWESLLLPEYRRLVEAIHGVGLCHWKHSDGNMYPFLDSIVDAGSDGIDPVDPTAGMELSVVKDKYGGRVAIKGNVDQVELLRKGHPDQVVEAVKACIRAAGHGGGYVCSSSNTIHSGVDPELYRVMVRAIHDYGTYPLDVDRLAPVGKPDAVHSI